MDERNLAGNIKDLARETGYTACGITSVEPFEEFRRALEELKGRFPDSASLYEKMFDRADPAGHTPWARSIIACVRRYGKYALPDGLTGIIGRNYLADSRVEGRPDHTMAPTMRDGLKKLGLRVKKGGVPDRMAGARAGVVRYGRNCFAYSQHGSWINIETWLVDRELPPDEPAMELACPKECTACIDACPTGALIEPLVMRMDKCVSFLTYSSPEPITEELWNGMGTWVYGCDACQDACPLNEGKWESLEPSPWLDDLAPHLTLEALAEMDEETYRTKIHPSFWYIPPNNIERWHRNAQRALTAPASAC